MSSDKPLIGYVVIDEYEEGMGHWGGHIAYPNPEGANLYWESPEPFIQKSYADSLEKQLKAERAKVADLMKAKAAQMDSTFRVAYHGRQFGKSMDQANKIADHVRQHVESGGLKVEIAAMPHEAYQAAVDLITNISHDLEETGLSLEGSELRRAIDNVLHTIQEWRNLDKPPPP